MNTDAIEIKHELELKIAKLRVEIDQYELDPDDYEEDFDSFLDCEGQITVAGYDYYPSVILKSTDPAAYRQELLNYVDGIDKEDDLKYIELVNELEEAENELAELEEALEK